LWQTVCRNSTKKVIDQGTKDLIDRLLRKNSRLEFHVSEPWLQKYVNDKYAQVSQKVQVSAKQGKLTIECDEAWSFVGKKVTSNG